jgi:hypothetical protein
MPLRKKYPTECSTKYIVLFLLRSLVADVRGQLFLKIHGTTVFIAFLAYSTVCTDSLRKTGHLLKSVGIRSPTVA